MVKYYYPGREHICAFSYIYLNYVVGAHRAVGLDTIIKGGITLFDRKGFKEAAKQQISGNIGLFFGMYLVMSLIISASGFTIVGPLLLTGPFTIGIIIALLNASKGIKPEFNNLFAGFQFFGKSLALFLLVGLFTFLWSLLLYVPGIIKMYSYSMSFYILAENPEMSALEAINESKRITDGKKMDLFVMTLSFFWWYMLGSITCGLGYIYVFPYMSMSFTNAYHAIKGGAYTPANPEAN